MRLTWKLWLYVVCALTDCASGMTMFLGTRTLAEAGAPDSYLGLMGGCLSLSAGVSSVAAGWLADRKESRQVFLFGAVVTCLSIGLCAVLHPGDRAFLAAYSLLGVGLGFVYPPLVAWLNEGADAHGNHRGVSWTLLLFCLSWNLGMLCGHWSAGMLFAFNHALVGGAAFSLGAVNLVAAVVVVTVKPRATACEPTPPAVAQETKQRGALFKRLSWMANLGGMFGGSLVMNLFPSLAVSIGVAADRHGGLLAGWRIVVIGTYILMHCASFWHFRLSTAVASQLLAAGGLMVISQAGSAPMLMLGLAMFGQLAGYNYFAGIFYSTAGSSQQGRALAAGIHEATLAAGMALGTILGGQLGTAVNRRLPYVLAAALLLALLTAQLVMFQVVTARRRRPLGQAVESAI